MIQSSVIVPVRARIIEYLRMYEKFFEQRLRGLSMYVVCKCAYIIHNHATYWFQSNTF